MTKTEILEALRLIAHGRINHPIVEDLAAHLAGEEPADPPVIVSEAPEPAPKARKRG